MTEALKPKPRVKICGLRDAAVVRAMDGLPVDEIGFLFAKSKRQVTPQQAGELIAEVRRLRKPDGTAPRTVGVFVDPTLERVREVLAAAPLDVVQLHGSEDPGLCAAIKREFGVDVWKVLSVGGDAGSEREEAALARLEAFRGTVDAVLIDTAGGGTGKTFAWELIPGYIEAAERIGVPLYAAGGLHPGNVGELLERYAPSGVDVSSGVETDGAKDMEKIRKFVERVKRA
ncbi:phosphoribosylanthranilate isomerase [Paenibacillus humicola]|uniref:phosphoribosylanthranilate isomerase n=1 Tax=Paenibacillus humicola TaxID=3110540 RepID=UPI00237A7E0B|nr:phosphoribosylanthranilate isomerase [Paenibacillus humicola]